jgi:hypothetical protein
VCAMTMPSQREDVSLLVYASTAGHGGVLRTQYAQEWRDCVDSGLCGESRLPSSSHVSLETRKISDKFEHKLRIMKHLLTTSSLMRAAWRSR